jgi:hypothetical protein
VLITRIKLDPQRARGLTDAKCVASAGTFLVIENVGHDECHSLSGEKIVDAQNKCRRKHPVNDSEFATLHILLHDSQECRNFDLNTDTSLNRDSEI